MHDFFLQPNGVIAMMGDKCAVILGLECVEDLDEQFRRLGGGDGALQVGLGLAECRHDMAKDGLLLLSG